ncbi:hypothetical protein GIV49_21360 [Pseudomonas syringae]|uniref:PD-(D/E)XK nuclease domain-containing protein n=1 Tax=Pseudomonas syringae TaxID=317 RepID=UPI001F415F93|nr:hypothetical protein [Pseudomonas syringae]MCF5652092.1 hypothetical protein [Pseudomonas syringae]
MLNRILIYLGLLREERSLADTILNTRSAVFFAKIMGVCAFISIGSNYIMWVHAVFEDFDLGNSAIREYLSSDYYGSAMRDEARQLERYNKGMADSLPPHLSFYFPTLGVIVKHEVSVVPGTGHRPDGTPQYKFENKFRVSLNFVHLIWFVLLMSMLLVSGLLFLSRRSPAALIRLEELELKNHFSPRERLPPTREMLGVDNRLALIFKRFNAFVVSLNSRQRGKPSFEVNDEYDVQDLMLPMLQMEFGIVKREVWGPDIAGSASRVDFQLVNEGVLIEIKKTRGSLSDRELSNELIVDVIRYSAYEHINKIVFFIYDPETRIRDPLVLLTDIEKLRDKVDVKIFISPRWYE